jgi:hypothetical protein
MIANKSQPDKSGARLLFKRAAAINTGFFFAGYMHITSLSKIGIIALKQHKESYRVNTTLRSSWSFSSKTFRHLTFPDFV